MSCMHLPGVQCDHCRTAINNPMFPPMPMLPALIPSETQQAFATFGMVMADLKAQRDAREEECDELRRHVRNLLWCLTGKVAKREISNKVKAAQEYLLRPRRSFVGSPSESERSDG